MKLTNAQRQRVGMRWGRLLQALEDAHQATAWANGERSLLSPPVAMALMNAHYAVASVKHAAWTEEAKSVTPRRTRRKKP